MIRVITQTIRRTDLLLVLKFSIKVIHFEY